MAAKKIIQEWLLTAEKDLKIAKEDIDKPERRQDVSFHDLETLLQICSQQNKEFDSIRTECKMLSPFYIGTRYPEFGEGLTGEEAVKSGDYLLVLHSLPNLPQT